MKFTNNATRMAIASAAAATAVSAQNISILAPLPPGFAGLNAVKILNNMAVIPVDFNLTAPVSPFYDLQVPNGTQTKQQFDRAAAADFIGFTDEFFDLIGSNATRKIVASFPGIVNHVHEAPTYIPETNQLLFSDTSMVGSLYLLDVDGNTLRNITTNPPLHNVNGGTYHNGTIYLCTNGGNVRGVFTFDLTSGKATPLVNNYRGRKLNSPNDIIAHPETGDLFFTDPAYGWYNEWPGAGFPELPNAVYFFNLTTNTLTALENNVVKVPNGLALSPDLSTLYVSDTAGTRGHPAPAISKLDGLRDIYAFDLMPGPLLTNPRMVYQADVMLPDGFRVSENGFIFAGTGAGVDVIDPRTARLLGKINAPNDVIYNFQFVPGTGTAFMTGANHIYRVEMKEKGLMR